jgi:hypothetical protein
LGRCEERERILNGKSKLERIGKEKKNKSLHFLYHASLHQQFNGLVLFIIGLYDHACKCANYTASNDRVTTECKRMWEEVAMA